MTSTAWEQDTLTLIHHAEREKRDAEEKLEQKRHTIAEKEQVIISLRTSLDYYRRENGLPIVVDPSPAVEENYGHLGPTDIVAKWADKHNGEIVIKDLATELKRTHIYSVYNKAYNAIYTVLKRHTVHYHKIKAGVYQTLAPDNTRAFIIDDGLGRIMEKHP